MLCIASHQRSAAGDNEVVRHHSKVVLHVLVLQRGVGRCHPPITATLVARPRPAPRLVGGIQVGKVTQQQVRGRQTLCGYYLSQTLCGSRTLSTLAILGAHSPVVSHTCLHLLYPEPLTHLEVGAGAHVARLLAVGRTAIAFGDVHRARRVVIICRADLTMLHRVRRLVPGGIIVRLMVYTHGN
jgi:hypothetical protein